MGLLTAIGWRFTRNLRREAQKLEQKHRLPRLERLIETPAGAMLLQSNPDPTLNGRTVLDFAIVPRDHRGRLVQPTFFPKDTQSPSVARQAMQQIGEGFEEMLREKPPRTIAYTPTTLSRQRAYRGLLQRLGRNGGVAFDEVEPNVWRRRLRPEDMAVERERAADLLRAQTLLAEQEKLIAPLRPLDGPVTYGAALGGFGGTVAVVTHNFQREERRRREERRERPPVTTRQW